MEHKPVYVTPEGFEALKAELHELVNVRRPALAERLHAAIKQGDLSENADYIAAKEEQGFLEGRILEVEYSIRNAQLIDSSGSDDGAVRIGCHVTVLEDGEDDAETYHLVGPAEADPARGKISHESPLGRALLGRRAGDSIAIRAPVGEIAFRILAVD
ncbi:MAG: transcription elongation factor GreA [Anaerolineae bacterium]|nr:transcription elongation factor GreA [Anaerolineae bacterium]